MISKTNAGGIHSLHIMQLYYTEGIGWEENQKEMPGCLMVRRRIISRGFIIPACVHGVKSVTLLEPGVPASKHTPHTLSSTSLEEVIIQFIDHENTLEFVMGVS